MGTRSGDIDPGLLLYLLRAGQMTPEQVDELLNHQSGLTALSGQSGDLREIEKAASEGHQASQVAMECFAYRVCKYIGAYAAALGGVDSLAFTGGIGEHSASMRARICERLSFLGLGIDDTRNQTATGQEPVAIGARDVRKVWIVPTDEERQIAREVFILLHR
jgi:acetate kinase